MTGTNEIHIRSLLAIKRKLQHDGICTEAVQAALLALAARTSPPDPASADAALTRISGIRNSIIGLQTMDWSEHIYPLVAALEDAGYAGMPYPEARENYGTTLQRAVAAEDRLETALAALHGLAVRTGLVAPAVAWDGPVLLAAVGCYLDASGPAGQVTPNLVTAARVLLDACVYDFGEPDPRDDEFRDDGAVAWSSGEHVTVTFAMIRDLQEALAGVEAEEVADQAEARADMVAELTTLREAEESGDAKVAWSRVSAAARSLEDRIRALDASTSPTTSSEVTP